MVIPCCGTSGLSNGARTDPAPSCSTRSLGSPQGSVTHCTLAGSCPLLGQPDLRPLVSDKRENTAPLRLFLAPEELGVLPGRVRGSWLGINSSAGGGGRALHSQSLEATLPGGQAGPCAIHTSPSASPLALSSRLLPAPRVAVMPDFPWLVLPAVPWARETSGVRAEGAGQRPGAAA